MHLGIILNDIIEINVRPNSRFWYRKRMVDVGRGLGTIILKKGFSILKFGFYGDFLPNPYPDMTNFFRF